MHIFSLLQPLQPLHHHRLHIYIYRESVWLYRRNGIRASWGSQLAIKVAKNEIKSRESECIDENKKRVLSGTESILETTAFHFPLTIKISRTNGGNFTHIRCWHSFLHSSLSLGCFFPIFGCGCIYITFTLDLVWPNPYIKIHSKLPKMDIPRHIIILNPYPWDCMRNGCLSAFNNRLFNRWYLKWTLIASHRKQMRVSYLCVCVCVYHAFRPILNISMTMSGPKYRLDSIHFPRIVFQWVCSTTEPNKFTQLLKSIVKYCMVLGN